VKSMRDNKGKPMTIPFELQREYSNSKEFIMQLFCFDLKNNTPVHVWPQSGFEIKVNNRPLALKKAGKKHPDQIADITVSTRPGSNSVQVLSQSYMPYVLVINLMRRSTVDSLMSKITSKKTSSFEVAFQEVKTSFFQNRGSDELEMISSKVSLRCPLTRTPLVTPTRATTCNHLQCFELKNYLLMNERVPTWICPICSKSALYKNLLVDAYMTRILGDFPNTDDMNEVMIQPDGTWQCPTNGVKKRKVEEIIPKGDVLELSDGEDSPKTNGHNPSVQNQDDPLQRIMMQELFSQNHSTTEESAQEQNNEDQLKSYSFACYTCKKTEDTKRCSRCKSISYCGKECQGMDWERHRLECRENGEKPLKQQKVSVSPKTEPARAPMHHDFAPPQNSKSLGSSAEMAIVLSDSD